MLACKVRSSAAPPDIQPATAQDHICGVEELSAESSAGLYSVRFIPDSCPVVQHMYVRGWTKPVCLDPAVILMRTGSRTELSDILLSKFALLCLGPHPSVVIFEPLLLLEKP